MKIHVNAIAARPGTDPDTASVSGEVLTHNGKEFDLSSVPEGGIAYPEGNHPFGIEIKRVGGVLEFSLRMRFDSSKAEANQPEDPSHWLVDVTEGEVPNMVIEKPVSEEPPYEGEEN